MRSEVRGTGCGRPCRASGGLHLTRRCAALLDRWNHLTRRVLPGMAAAEGWPIRLDHCFMRVCLDAAFGRPWHEAVRRPAVRHMTEAELARAVSVAERIAANPALLSERSEEHTSELQSRQYLVCRLL